MVWPTVKVTTLAQKSIAQTQGKTYQCLLTLISSRLPLSPSGVGAIDKAFYIDPTKWLGGTTQMHRRISIE